LTIDKAEISQLRECLSLSLKDLFEYENDFVNKSIKEESINHRLAVYIDCHKMRFSMIKNYEVDVEYDKMADNTEDEISDLKKKFIDQNGNEITIRPDIIIHKRFTNQFNRLYIECKKCYLSKNDRFKIKNVLQSNLNYSLSLGIEYHPNKNYYRVYEKIDNNWEYTKHKKPDK